MNQRERLLAIVVGSLFGLFLLNWSIPKIFSTLTTRNNRIEQLRQEIQAKNNARKQLIDDKAALAILEEQSLCRDPDFAQSLYKTWLIKTVKEDVAFKDVIVTSGTIQRSGDVYLQHSFKVTGKGDLKQLTDFLYRFYQANHLHRIRQLAITPNPRVKNQMQLAFSIDAISLQSVSFEKKLSTKTSDALAEDDKQFYLDRIVQRNLFGPGNESAPRFSRRTASQSLILNEAKSFKLSATDSDNIASYEIVKHNLPEDATIEWTPEGTVNILSKKLGDFTLEVRATDKGLPAKTSEIAKIAIRVREKAAPPEVKTEPPKFDFANTAFFIASVEVAGQPEAWVMRRESRKTLKLHVGDNIDIGSIKGKIVRISLKELELAEGNERLIIQAGKALSSASFVVQAAGSE